MKTELHLAVERGHASHGWLDSYHSFSFATYFNPAREKFGCLRVLNDDTVAGGTGFDLHPHNNMEIITVMLEGELAHRDSMGNIQVIVPGEVQVMSAGTGIYHAEYNNSETENVKLFQIWIFPRERGLKPRYDQKLFVETAKSQLTTLVTPDNLSIENTLWIHQDAFISKLSLEKDHDFEYKVRMKGNGVFAIVVEGSLNVEGNTLSRRDAIAVSDTELFKLQSVSDSKVLFIEIPMQ
jgi:hypothetical protein